MYFAMKQDSVSCQSLSINEGIVGDMLYLCEAVLRAVQLDCITVVSITVDLCSWHGRENLSLPVFYVTFVLCLCCEVGLDTLQATGFLSKVRSSAKTC